MLDEGNRAALGWAITRGMGQTIDELNAQLLTKWDGPIEEFVPVTREELLACMMTPHDAAFWGNP
jgi:hypothetical protein